MESFCLEGLRLEDLWLQTAFRMKCPRHGSISSSICILVARRKEIELPLKLMVMGDYSSAVIAQLPHGTEVTVSGEGAFRKLERVNQYVHFNSLEGTREPKTDRIVVLDQPVAIKAGDLIGHIGKYQDSRAEHPEKKLHLEVFSADDVETFLSDSQDWARQMPATDKTWLKLAKGTAVVFHQNHFNAAQPPKLSDAGTRSDADLLVPKSMLDGMSAERKIAVPATAQTNAYNWYRLDELLHDANSQFCSGWVREEVGVTSWVNPWSWEGYDVIFNYDTPRQALAYLLRAIGRFSEDELERHGALADTSDRAPVRSRLYDIIDRDKNGTMTAEELRVAIGLPAQAQSLSQLIIHYESEWRHTPQKWDALDEILGHSGSTPLLNSLAEKGRIKQMSWWDEVATKVGLPAHGQVYHMHPVGLVGSFCVGVDDNDLRWLKVPYGQLTFDVEVNDIENESHPLYRYFSRVVHWPGGASGITIGRGYDLGQRPAPGLDLRAAGIPEPLLSWLIGAKGLQGAVAKTYLDNAPMLIKKHKITRRQQYDLFLPVYDFMKSEVIRISDRQSNRAAYGLLNWNAVNRRIQDIVIDLIYRGDYHKDTRPYIQKPFVENDPERMRAAISNQNIWGGVPPDRFQRRKDYMNQ